MASDPSQSPRSPRVRRATLSLEEIVAAARELIEEAGVSSFSMRALAAHLDANTASIYWHAGSRDEVLSAVAAEAISAILVPDPSLPWQDQLAAFAGALRQQLTEQPRLAGLIVDTLVMSPQAFPTVEFALATLSGAGFEDQSLRHAYNVFVGYCFGYLALALAPRAGKDASWQEIGRSNLTAIDPETTPVLAANIELLSNAAFGLRWDPAPQSRLDDSFDIGLAIVLSGLSSLLPPDKGDRSVRRPPHRKVKPARR